MVGAMVVSYPPRMPKSTSKAWSMATVPLKPTLAGVVAQPVTVWVAGLAMAVAEARASLNSAWVDVAGDGLVICGSSQQLCRPPAPHGGASQASATCVLPAAANMWVWPAVAVPSLRIQR